MIKTPEEFHNRIEKKIDIEFWITPTNSIEIGQFWRYYEGINVWNEISKDNQFKRVCLILNNNLWNGLVLVAPITTKHHKHLEKFYVEINDFENYWLKTPRIILNQIKMIDKKRVSHKTSENKISFWFVMKVVVKFTNLILPQQ